jgi:hypothetical protein
VQALIIVISGCRLQIRKPKKDKVEKSKLFFKTNNFTNKKKGKSVIRQKRNKLDGFLIKIKNERQYYAEWYEKC